MVGGAAVVPAGPVEIGVELVPAPEMGMKTDCGWAVVVVVAVVVAWVAVLPKEEGRSIK